MVRDPRETTEMVVEAGAGSSENEVSGRPRNTGTKETSPFEAPIRNLKRKRTSSRPRLDGSGAFYLDPPPPLAPVARPDQGGRVFS